MRLPTEDAGPLFDTIVGWGRFGELFGYASDAKEIYLDEPDNVRSGAEATAV